MPFVRQKIDPAWLDWVTKHAGSHRDEYGGDWAFDASRNAAFFFKGADALDPNLPRHYLLKVGTDVFPVQILDSERSKTLPAGTAKILMGPAFGAIMSRDVARQLAIEAYRCLHGSPTQNFQTVTSWGAARNPAVASTGMKRPAPHPDPKLVGNQLYSPQQAGLAALFGGPMAAIYVLQKNFQQLGDVDRQRTTIRIGAAIMIALLVAIGFLPPKFLGSGFAIGCAIAVSTLVKTLQMTKEDIASSGVYEFQSNWNVLAVAILAVVSFFALAAFWMTLLILFGYRR